MSSVSTSRTTWCFWTVLFSPWQDTTCGSTSLTACFSSLNSIFVYTDVQFGDAWSDSIIRMKCRVCFVGSAGYVCVLSFDNGEKQDIDKFAYVVRRAAALRNDWPSR